MNTILQFPQTTVSQSRLKDTSFSQLEFGKVVSDHMLVADFVDGEWTMPQVFPYSNLSLAPSALCLHYGQTVFEGMKAFRMHDGNINLFRPYRHHERFLQSLDRMCMPVIPTDYFVEGLVQLLQLDRDWVPADEGSALYIRPFVIATEARFGVKISDEYRMIIFTGPVPPLYQTPIRVKVETRFSRAAAGGTGYAKCGGNYGGSFYPTRLARQEGYDQVLWTDSREHRFIEESGMMNVFFVIDGCLVTTPLSDTILDGITRESLLLLAADLGIATAERPVSLQELEEGLSNGRITEAFGAGTAAVVAPIKTIHVQGTDHDLPAYHSQSIHRQLAARMNAIRTGRERDKFNWNFII